MKIVLLSALALFIGGCVSQPPFRGIETVNEAHCKGVFGAASISYADGWQAARSRIGQDLADPVRRSCWTNSQEIHADYDLLTVEFDDQGWLAVPRDAPAGANSMARLARRLEDYSRDKQSVTLVVYTHGWHHSAQTDDRDVIAFRHLLRRLAVLEDYLCEKRSRDLGIPSCEQASPGRVQPWQTKRRVVGVYVGWRGDSLVGPGIQFLSVWDRKLAAEKVAYGAAQELYARLHDYYTSHGCRSSSAPASCLERADVRMLTIGHSYGALITYRALAPRLMSAIIERSGRDYRDRLPYAYSFGDLTVLINPAFEATRLEPLARAAIERQYNTGHGPYTAQLPILVMAQSSGDLATDLAFPAFRRVTTLFEETGDQQYEPNVTAAGWSDRYKTHDVFLDKESSSCRGWSEAGDFRARVHAEAAHVETLLSDLYKPFHADLSLCGGIVLKRHESGGKPVGFTPVWSLRMDPKIVEDHNDFLNVNLQHLFRQIFFAYLREQDEYHVALVRAKCKEGIGEKRVCEKVLTTMEGRK